MPRYRRRQARQSESRPTYSLGTARVRRRYRRTPESPCQLNNLTAPGGENAGFAEPFHSESPGKPRGCATSHDGTVTGAFVPRLPSRPKDLAEPPLAAPKNGAATALRTPKWRRPAPVPFGFPTNLRYLRIPSRFFPAIPICGGFLYLFILALDGRDRLGLALKSSARG